ncbi:MAG: molybdopterin-dependent oxidoreductase Mo/Fe-S-binding subunit [Sphaerochaetaceae bacterium]|nr:molybdopterin-dependent oxidoreductase Mo/Fe-S-binding subunit [Sphaerochaetaceae bacterium]
MRVDCIINGKNRSFDVDASMRLRQMLELNGNFAVRDSDDNEGFCGSDTVLVDGVPVYANLALAGEVQGCEIRTPDGLGNSQHLTVVQQAMIDAGVVQSAYNAPAAALLLTWLLETNPNPSKEEIKDALSGIFIRDAGYEHYYLAVKLAREKLADGKYTTAPAPSFRENLKIVGKPASKIDGPQLVAGEKAFVEDFVDPHSCHMVVLRSPHASAYINSIDTTEAEKVEGVVKILTAYNTPDTHYMQAGQGNPEPSPHDRRLFNMKVRHVGDRVAAVIAETLEAACQARDLIKVDYEVLPAVFTVEEAMAEGAPLVHNGIVEYRAGAPADLEEYNKLAGDPREGKVVYQFPLHADIHKNIAASNKGGIGDVEKAFREADAVVEHTYQTSQIQHAPLEPHVCFAKMEAGRLVVVASTQVPYHVRRIVGWVTGLPENKIHVIKTRVGGGYGSKQDILVEDLVGYASYVTGKPIYYRNTREEEFIANSTRHPMRVHVKMSGKKDGTITGIYMEVCANTGPFGNHCLTVPMNSCSKTLPLFKCDNMYYDLKVYYTNTPPAGAYQGYGTPKGTYGLMMAMAELADALGCDYKEMVLKNHVEEGYMLEILKGLGEGREGNVVPVGSCGLREAVLKGCDMIKWGQKEESGDPDWKIGKGFAMIMQGSGLPGLDHSEAIAKLETDGTVILNSGGADLGTGLDTISAKICSEVLCMPLDKITVVSGDTDSCAFDTGAYASSGTFFSGNASLEAAKLLKSMILKEAAFQMNEKEEDLELVEPGAVKSKATGKVLTYAELSHTACSGTGHGQMIAHGNFVTAASSVPYGAHFAQVAVNVKTGEIKVQKFYALQDAGTPINPEIALCQMYGAVMKSIGHSLYEDMKLDKDGRCINANMTDYGVPMITEAPEDFKSVLIDVNDAYGPFGAKSISEIACNGAAPAIGIAIHDACGIWLRDWPMTPEKILKALGKI